MKKLRTIFITGLFVLIPIVVTFWIIKTVLSSVNNLILPYLREAGLPIPDIPGIGIIITILVILILGLLGQNYAGKKLLDLWDSFIGKIPVVRSIYSATKQTMETLFAKKESFSKTVLVQFPREGNFAIGFISNELKICNIDYYIVFIPFGINPTGGHLIIVKKEDVILTDLSVDEAMRTIISGGLAVKKQIKLIKEYKEMG
ncbi:DUF502 domain-containing protein [Venenivibrio stagnispumantis]|uniref:Uncharacterized membrane protein n=1 Tax=Venenivibrio stagnispumantis TaxID=407998 RepID=A0AA46AG26_9AQUI|nr:DUF502 domain-containing protein [Venenivibrio stagnispumantis]MCW4574081.1 DUF502 domain-containing protein [Venenivibrio stagnispumantis]SMP24774.1 Uncharacterized membrane protein [Venenivibrio stagnispumantis]